MTEVLASALPTRPVVSVDGRKLGRVHNITMELKSGELKYLIVGDVETDRPFDDLERTDDGRLQVPATALSGASDQVVVDLSGLS